MSLLDDVDDNYSDAGDDWADQVVDQAAPQSSPADNFEEPRKQNFLLGHDEQKTLIQRLFDDSKMPHGWILTGPDGIGKATFAYHMAKFLLNQPKESAGQDALFGAPAPNENSAEPLGYPLNSPITGRIEAASHGDFTVLDLESTEGKKDELKVDQIRQVVQFLQKTSSEGGWRIVLIDNAEIMNNAAQNALLKVLEEPPEKTVLILVTSSPSSLLPTIKSRCRLLSFKALNDDDISQLIARSNILAERPDITPKQAVNFAEGRFGYLKSFLKGNAAEIFAHVIEGLDALPNTLNRQKLLDTTNKILAEKRNESVQSFFQITRWWLNRLMKDITGIKAYQPMSEPEAALIGNLKEACDQEKMVEALSGLWEKIGTFEQDYQWANFDPQTIIFEIFLMFENEIRKTI